MTAPTMDLADLVREMRPVAAAPDEHAGVVDLYRALSDLALDPKQRSVPSRGRAPE